MVAWGGDEKSNSLKSEAQSLGFQKVLFFKEWPGCRKSLKRDKAVRFFYFGRQR